MSKVSVEGKSQLDRQKRCVLAKKRRVTLFLALAMMVASFGSAGAVGAPIFTYYGDPGFIASNP